jgi:CRISPR-associated endonuclease/helicase Cas3
MPDLLFRYWGKAKPDREDGPQYHPLPYHCLDVAACGSVLLEHQTTWLGGLSQLSGIQAEALRLWLRFLLAIHDIGKFANGFQQQRSDLQKELQGRETNIGGGERHDTLGYVLGAKYLLDWLGQGSYDEDMFALLQPWLAAVTGHHGRPPKNDGSAALMLHNHFPAPVVADAKQFVIDIAGLLLPEGIPLPSPDFGLEERYQQASWLLAGLAVTADWLGSNTLWFRYREPVYSLTEYWHDIALPQARKAVEESGLIPARASSFTGIRTLFPKIREATPLQTWAETTPIAPEPQIFVLEELTGGGKTEATLTLAARLLEAGQGKGVYLALPTMATTDAMFDRVRKDESWRRFFADGAAQLVLAHSADHLKLRLEEKNMRDAGYGKDEGISASRHCTAWLSDSRKKALLADFGVGTLDQALLAVLPVRHQSLRLLGLAGKVLIVDEVHACDCYMGELLVRLLSFHAALGGSAILLSATLPIAQRARYLQAFAQGAGFIAKEPKNTAYPLTTHMSATYWDEQRHVGRKESARTVAVDALFDEVAVFQRLKTTVERGGCAVWVRNSVADAVQTWQGWKKTYPEHPAILFHARFALVDRLRIGKTILETFGPGSTAEVRRGRLVIATQVIEQSLDVDFDDMVTDLAPIDLVIQRAGRLQRHVRDADGNRLDEKDAIDRRSGARLAVLMPEPVEDAGKDWISKLLPKTGKVYPDHGKLWLTTRWLFDERGFELPRQARDMIESVYAESAFDHVPDSLKDVSEKADGACRAGRSVARGNLLNFGEGYNPTSQQWQNDVKTPTRLNEVATVRVRLARLVNGALVPWANTDTGMEWALSELNVPDYLVAQENLRMKRAWSTPHASPCRTRGVTSSF